MIFPPLMHRVAQILKCHIAELLEPEEMEKEDGSD